MTSEVRPLGLEPRTYLHGFGRVEGEVVQEAEDSGESLAPQRPNRARTAPQRCNEGATASQQACRRGRPTLAHRRQQLLELVAAAESVTVAEVAAMWGVSREMVASVASRTEGVSLLRGWVDGVRQSATLRLSARGRVLAAHLPTAVVVIAGPTQ